jgi:hypothetical protein
MSADLIAFFTAQQILAKTQAISYDVGLLETGIDGNLRVQGQIAGTSDLTIGLPLAPANVDFTVGTMAISGLTGNITSNVLYYDTSSGGMTYGDIIRPTSSIIATSATPIDITASSSGNVYILTGTTLQSFTHTSLIPADAGVFVFVKNGNGTNGGDITISGATGSTVIHNQTNNFNGQMVAFHWNGSALISH